MKFVIQKTAYASVSVEGTVKGKIGKGFTYGKELSTSETRLLCHEYYNVRYRQSIAVVVFDVPFFI